MPTSTPRPDPLTLGDFENQICEIRYCGHTLQVLTSRLVSFSKDDIEAVYFLAGLVIDRCNSMNETIQREVSHG